MIYTKLEIDQVEYNDALDIAVSKTVDTSNGISTFKILFDNYAGRHSTDFEVHQEVIIYADKDSTPASTIVVKGVIEDIHFEGKGVKERLIITGSDYASLLRDIIADPRIFKDVEVSEIVTSLMSQNISSELISLNNINITSTTLDKITFTNISLFEALKQLAEISGFFFYIDNDRDLHFEERSTTSSGQTFDNTNVLDANFKTTDHDIYNRVTVYGDRQLTGAQEVFITGLDNVGSSYILEAKPSNVVVTVSGAINTQLQPGGVLNINNPAEDNIEYLVDYQARKIILTSGTVGGDHVQTPNTVMVFDYQRSTPIASEKNNYGSQQDYGLKDKIIVDRNIKDPNEASTKAQSFLDEHAEPKTNGKLYIDGVLNVTPGNTANIYLPNFNQSGTYSIVNSNYDFNSYNNHLNQVLTINLNKKIPNFIDRFKEQILRLRALEAAEVDSNIMNIETGIGSVGVSGTYKVIQRSIGSAFYFHTPGHDQLNSPTALLGDMRLGSTVIEVS